MRLRTTVKWFSTGALVVLVAGSATAQQPASGGASSGATTDAQIGLDRQPRLSPADALAHADQDLARMEQASGVVRRQLEQAREARDVVKTLCLNDKLSQIDVAIRSARDRKTSLQSAVNGPRPDSDLANHEASILVVLRQRVEQTTAEANQCIGEELSFVGKTEVVTTVDPSIPQSDVPYYPGTDTTLISGFPQCVSGCF
jgi:hypothetical protein